MKMKHLSIMIAAASLSITASAAVEPLMQQISWANVYTNNPALNAESEIVTNALIILTESHSSVTNALEESRQNDPSKSLACNDGFYGPDVTNGSVSVVYPTGEATFKTNAYSIGKSASYLEYTLQNNAATNLQLSEIRFDLVARFKTKSNPFVMTYEGGDLGMTPGFVVGSEPIPNNPLSGWGLQNAQFDMLYDLAGMPDSILDSGESATFRLRFTIDTASTVVDNLMFLGEFGVLDNANIPPSFTNNPIRVAEIATIDVAYSNDLSGIAVDPESDTIYYAKVSGPSWLDVLPDGTVTGTPVVARLDEFTISATDSNSAPVEAVIEVVVTDPVLEAYDMVAWTGENNRFADTKTPTAQNVSAQMFDAIADANVTRNTVGGSFDHDYGTIFMTPVAEDNSWALQAAGGQVYTIAITNKTVYDMSLDGFYLDYKRNSDTAPSKFTISYVSGDLDDAGPADIGSHTATNNAWADIDIAITNQLADTLLEAGEYAVFEITFTNAIGANKCMFDNFMLRLVRGEPSDTDDDGLADNWEVNFFGSITNSDGTADFDLDGFLDASEFGAGPNPTNALSLLVVESFVSGTNANEYVIQWQSANDRTYRITSTDDLVFGAWDTTNASGIVATPTTNVTTVTSTLSPAFFRVEVE
jgi:hypothetical protein